jgi:SAM-dependent methyltransferase
MEDALILDERAWFETTLGQYVLAREQAYCDEAVSDIFGFNAVQLGLSQFDLLRASRIPFRMSIGPSAPAQLRADLHQLPIASQSVDLVLMPHVLEFSATPHQLLREVERVLIPEGHVIIAGFNPFSLWGARRLFAGEQPAYPWRGKFLTLPRVKDWLALLGFEVTGGKLACYIPPVPTPKWIERFQFMEAAGDRWWPLGGGVYFLLAKKRVQGMRLIMPKWQDRVAAQKRFAAATQRQVQTVIHDDDELCA